MQGCQLQIEKVTGLIYELAFSLVCEQIDVVEKCFIRATCGTIRRDEGVFASELISLFYNSQKERIKLYVHLVPMSVKESCSCRPYLMRQVNCQVESISRNVWLLNIPGLPTIMLVDVPSSWTNIKIKMCLF